MINTDEVGNKIKNLRESKNYTQEYVAFRLGISQNNYSRLEREPAKLTLSRANKLCEILDISFLELMFDRPTSISF